MTRWVGPDEVARRVAAYATECPYCGAQPGEACKAMNRRASYCQVPHVHRMGYTGVIHVDRLVDNLLDTVGRGDPPRILL